MTSIWTYCLTPEITRELINELNRECGIGDLSGSNEESPLVFLSARSPPLEKHSAKVEQESQEPLEIFDRQSTEELARFYEEHADEKSWITAGIFAVLDGQSAKDKTIVIYSYQVDLEIDEHNDPRPIEQRYLSWRFVFQESFLATSNLEHFNPEIIDDVLSRDEFLDKNGVCHFEEASKQIWG